MAGDVIIVGSVGVEVAPVADRFWVQFVTQNLPQAGKVGQQLGDAVGRGMSDRISAGVSDGVTKGGRDATGAATKAGTAAGEAFGKSAKARIEAALKNIPDVKIDGDSSKLDRKIAAVRAAIKELSDRVDLDLDDDEAAARLAALRTQLADLVREVQRVKESGGDIPLGLDVFKLQAEIAALQRELKELQKPVKVPVEADTSALGRFETELQARVRAAIRALPKVDITADSSDVDRRIDAIRGELEVLSDRDRRIRLGIDDAAALAVLADLRRELEEIAAKSPSVRVRADAAAAVAQLAAVQAQTDKLAASRPTVTVDADAGGAAAELGAVDAASTGATGSIGNLVAAVLLLGPALIPVGAVGVGALFGIASAAGAVVAALGVVVLALAPVIAAVQAMGAAQGKSAASAASMASQQNAVANASDQVRSAQAALANTVASTADAQRRAAEQIATAETSLADAQRSAAQAQQELTQARKDEAQAQEDLNLQVQDGALAQRQANLDVITSKQALDQVLANPTATALQRQQAQLTYDQAVQQTTDLGVRQQRLIDQQTQNTKTGVDGAASVVAAQNRVVQANEQVAKAQQAVSDAQIAAAQQARQAAFQVAQAQQAVISAQRSLQQATVSAGTAGGAAMNTLAQKMAALTPIGREFATFLYGLRGIFSQLSAAAQNSLLPGLEQGIKILLPLVPQLVTFISSLGRTLGDLFVQGAQALTNPFWTQFFAFVSSAAGPILTTFANIVGNVATGFAGLLQAFAPVTNQLGAGLLGLSQRFADFGANASHNEAFQNFLAYVERVGPQVAGTLGDLARATGHLLAALAPIGGAILGAIRDLANGILAIPLPVLTVVGGLILGIVAAMKAYAITQAIGIGITKAWGAAQVAASIVTKGLTAETFALDAAMDANPIGLVILAIAALVVGVIYAYTHFKTFRDIVQGAWEGIKVAALFTWNNVLQPIFDHWKIALIVLLGPLGVFIVAVVTFWSQISAAASWAWNNIIKPVFDAWVFYLQNFLMPVMLFFWHGVVEPVWAGTQLAISIAWALIQVLFGLISIQVRELADIFSWLYDHVIHPVMDLIGTAIEYVWLTKIKPVLTFFGDIIKTYVAPAFQAGVNAIESAWNRVLDIAKAPVRFIVQTVLNDGLLGAYNWIASKFGVKPDDVHVKLPAGFARGGFVDGPGGPTDDAILARLSAGEYIVPARVVAALGVDFFDELVGRGPRSRTPGDGSQGIAFPGFALGGLVGALSSGWKALTDPVGWLKGKVHDLIGSIPGGGWAVDIAAGLGRTVVDGAIGYVKKAITNLLSLDGSLQGPLDADAGAVVSFIKAQNNKPYVWAAAGPEGYDCSGFVSAVWNLAHGKNPYNHTFSTFDEAKYFPRPGHGLFTAGWAGPGEKGGGSVGHTAGLFAGVPFESGGALGNVHWGPGSTGVDTFAHVGTYDRGGYLYPGLTLAYNGTGRPETVRTAGQESALGGGRPIEINVYPQATQSPAEIAAQVNHELAWALR